MKLNTIGLILISSIVLFLSSCLGTTDVTIYSTNPCFSSLTFAANDSGPNQEKAVFSLEFDSQLNDSIIVNLDSLPYNTRIDNVHPTFSFKSSSGARILYTDTSDSVIITGTDTIVFSRPLNIRNYAADKIKTHNRLYVIKVNVHKVEPELYVWRQLNKSIESYNATSQKTIWFNNQLYYYLNNGSNAYLYTSANGTSWSTETTLSGLPLNTPLGDMLEFNGKLYLTQDGAKIYSSANGLTWTSMIMTDYTFKSLLFDFDSKIWAVVQSNSDSKLRFANSTDGDTWIVRGEIPINFPVRDFASISFLTRNGKPKVLVVGGYSSNGISLKNRWSSEDCVNWFDFSQVNHSLDTLAVGASVIAYENKLFLFGGMEMEGQLVANHYKQSIDEGLSWQPTDSVYNKIHEPVYTKVSETETDTTYVEYQARNYQSVVLDNSDRIYIVGGKSNLNVLSDVWTGKLNRKSFIKQ